MSRRIAYVSSRFPVLRESFIIREVLALQREGVEVTVFTLKEPEPGLVSRDLDEIRAEVYWTPHLLSSRLVLDNLATLASSPIAYLGTCLRNAWRVRRYPMQVLKYVGLYPKMVHYGREMQRRGLAGMNSCWANIPSVTASVAQRLFDLKFCMTCRAWDIFVPMNQVDLASRVRVADMIRTNNLNGARYMRRFCSGEHDEAKIHTVYNPFDVAGIAPRRRLPDGPLRITAGGSLFEQKGLNYLVDAVALLKQRDLDVRLDLIGRGDQEQPLREQAKQLGIEERVRFLGTMPNGEVLERMTNSHAFVLPSVPTEAGWMDGIPNVLIESLALGVPAVSTSISGIPELIDDGQCGLLVPPRDPLALADALQRLLGDRALQETFGRNGPPKVASLFAMDVNARRLAELYDRAGLIASS